MKPIISVIIPIYNTARYLDDCIQSVLNQTVGNLQIILVNDGSTDESPAICDKWVEKDGRIQVIHKENEGLGYTRNAGLKVAKGQYISFLDSDDTLDGNTYEICMDKMENCKADACYFGRKTMLKNGEIQLNFNIPSQLCYNSEMVRKEYAKNYFGILSHEEQFPYIQGSSCCALYRRDIIVEHDIHFCSEREYLSEDIFFNLDICKHASCICIIPENFYNYTYNPGSLTKTYSNDKFERCKKMTERLFEYAKEYDDIIDVEERICCKFLGITRGLLSNYIQYGPIIGENSSYKQIKKTASDTMVKKLYGMITQEKMNKRTKLYVNMILQKKCYKLLGLYLIRTKLFKR